MKFTGRIRLMVIGAIAALKSIFLLYYLRMHTDSALGYWEMLLGGLQAAEGRVILFVVIQTLPDFLFYYFVGGYIGELKDNYVYIFVRERNMKYWIRRFAVRSLSEVLFYQAAAALLLFVAGICLQRGVFIELGRFAFLFLCQFVKISVFMLFCNILFFRINELAAVYADLVIQALPPFAVGVLYDMEGAWRLAVKYVPFNWCSYSYVQQAGLDPAVMLCLLMAAGMLSYWYLEKLFSNYEVV